MEEVPDVYQQTDNQAHALICVDEASRQILSNLMEPLPMQPGSPRRVDDKYQRNGVRSLFMFCNPLNGWRGWAAGRAARGVTGLRKSGDCWKKITLWQNG